MVDKSLTFFSARELVSVSWDTEAVSIA